MKVLRFTALRTARLYHPPPTPPRRHTWYSFLFKVDSHTACRSHAVSLPCRAAKGLECVFPIWFTQCGRVWLTLAKPCPCHAPTIPFFPKPQRGRRETAVLCCGHEKNGMVGAWHGHGMASVNQTRPYYINQMEKTHSKPLAARHDRGMAWARHGNGMLCVNRPLGAESTPRP
jgi:hypothetical protein